MSKRKVLIFDIWGDLGHFRKFYTTSSPLTYPCPPPTTIRGIVAAIVGIDKNQYIPKTNTIDIGVKIINPVKKVKMGMNYIDTKHSSISDLYLNIANRTQVYLEFVKFPRYRIYVRPKENENEIFYDLRDMLRENKSFYSVSLGLAYLLADFEFVGEGECEDREETDKVDTLFVSDSLVSLKTSGLKISKDRMLMYMYKDRVPGEYKDTIVDIVGNRMEGKFKNISIVSYEGGEDYVFFFTVPS